MVSKSVKKTRKNLCTFLKENSSIHLLAEKNDQQREVLVENYGKLS